MLYISRFPCFILFVYLIIQPNITLSNNNHCDRDSCKSNLKKKPMKTILFWTPFYSHRDYTFGFGHAPFKECPVNHCVTTNDRTAEESADAVLFHMRNVNRDTKLPTMRNNNQRYVFFLMEHPYNQWNDLKKWNGFFNLTMTYRHDSDIRNVYGRVQPIPIDQADSAENIEPIRRDVEKRKMRKLVAWFVSNCKTHSKREEYVRELQKYIPIHIYGKCGSLRCPANRQVQEVHLDSECYEMLEKEYKFYLSFENIHCEDYVTEKLFHPLNRDVVPVVMGGTNYTRDSPPNSVININDFKSPKDLADYLKYLDQEEDEYDKYMEWKKSYRVVLQNETIKEAFCRLCEVLNYDRFPIQSYDHLDRWWGKGTKCDKTIVEGMKKSWR